MARALVVISIPLTFWGAIALAGSGDAALAQIDEALSTAADQAMEYEMSTKEPGKEERRMAFKVFVKGKEWRRIDFLSPGDVKDMRILVRSVSNMYVYLPAYRKVRRLASHVKEQGFMGTAFSHDEMSLATFSPVYSANLLEESDKHWKLEAIRKEGSDFPYPKLILEARKDLRQPVEIQYFNSEGQKVKTETRLKFSCNGNNCAPGVIEMVDHTRNNLKSVLTMRQWTPNAGLDDSFFSVRALQRSN